MANFDVYLNSDSSGKLQVLRQLFTEVNDLTLQVKTLVSEISDIKNILKGDINGSKNNN